MRKIEIKAQPRTITGKQVKSLRKAGFIPAVIYGNKFTALNIQIPIKEFSKVYSEAGESTLVYVNLDNESYPSIIHNVAVDPVSDLYIHADFYKVRLDEKIKAGITVELIGESPAVKSLGGILVKNINEIEVEGLPQNLPHAFEIDISKLEKFGDNIKIKDLKIESDIEVLANPEDIILLIQEPISEEKLKEQLETTSADTVDEVEVIKKEKKEEEPAEENTEPKTAPEKP